MYTRSTRKHIQFILIVCTQGRAALDKGALDKGALDKGALDKGALDSTSDKIVFKNLK